MCRLLYFEAPVVHRNPRLAHPSICPYGAFATKDGALVLISIQTSENGSRSARRSSMRRICRSNLFRKQQYPVANFARWWMTASDRPSPP